MILMNAKNPRIGGFKLLMLVAIMLYLSGSAHAASSIVPTASQGFSQAVCNGNGATGGVIPLNNVLAGQAGGEKSLLFLSILIMLVMLMIIAIIYMISYVFDLEMLRNFAKIEIGEIIITGILVFIFIGSFNAISSATSGNVFHIAGTSFGRDLYVSDCSYLSSGSVSLIAPFLAINFIRTIGDTAASIKVSVEFSFFGFEDSPFTGFKLFDTMLGYLDDITGAFIVLNLGIMLLLGLIFILFPLFLYIGIILRTLPWTRAAGGAFLGVFVGFYIALPILLHVMLGVYVPSLAAQTGFTGINPSMINSIFSYSSGITSASFVVSTLKFLENNQLFIFGNGYGIVNGFLYWVIEPAVFTFLSVIISFIIAFDVSEFTGGILGAPSLKAENIFSKMFK